MLKPETTLAVLKVSQFAQMLGIDYYGTVFNKWLKRKSQRIPLFAVRQWISKTFSLDVIVAPVYKGNTRIGYYYEVVAPNHTKFDVNDVYLKYEDALETGLWSALHIIKSHNIEELVIAK